MNKDCFLKLLNKEGLFILSLICFVLISKLSLAFSDGNYLLEDQEKKSSELVVQNPTQNEQNINQFKIGRARLSTEFMMQGLSFAEGQDSAQVVQLFIQPIMTLPLHKTLSLNADIYLGFGSSRVQTRFEDPNLNNLNVNELILLYQPAKLFSLEIGAINQNHFESPLMIYYRAFPGLKANFDFKIKNIQARLKAQLTIPNSTSLESDRSSAETLPLLHAEGVEISWKPLEWLNINANINYFAYSNLPSIVAFESSRLGNQVIGETQSESSFAYDFEGLSQFYNFSADYSKKLSQDFEVHVIDNFKAPSDRRRTQAVFTRLNFEFKNFSLSPELGVFYAESDSVPAVYSQAKFGRNNRTGQSVGLKVDFKNLGFSVSANYINSDLIEERPVQRDLDYLAVTLGVANVKF